MSLTWHIVQKDLRRLGLPLALWAVVLVGKIGIGLHVLGDFGAALPHDSETTGEWIIQMRLYQTVLIGIELVACYMLVAALIHEDPLTGAHMFWRTRPISGARLLGAKLLGIVLMFGALPLLIWLPWWLYCSYGWHEMLRAAPETLACNSAVVMTAMSVAVLTNNLTRFLTWTLVFVVTVFTMSLALEASRPTYIAGGMLLKPSGLTETREMVAIAFALLTMAIVVGRQFLVGRALGSVGAIALGAGLIVTSCLWWPWDGSKYWNPQEETLLLAESSALARDVAITIDEAQLLRPRGNDDSTNHNAPRIFVRLVAHDVPRSFGLSFLHAEEAWRWPDGVTVKYDSGFHYEEISSFGYAGPLREALGLPTEAANSDFVKWLSAQRVNRGWPPIRIGTGNEHMLDTVETLSPSVASRMLVEPPAYSLNAVFGLTKPEVRLANVSLFDRNRHRFGSQTLRVTQASVGVSHSRGESNTDELIKVIESRATSWRDGLGELFPLSFPRSNERSGWFLVNRARGELSSNGSPNWEGGEKIRIGTVEIAWRNSLFHAPLVWQGGGKWKGQENWFEGVTLAETASHEVGRFSREVKVSRLEVKPLTEPAREESP